MACEKYEISELRVFFFYFFIPVFLFTVFSGLYITGSEEIREVIAPQVNREFGLLENMQNLVLIAAIGYSIFIYFRMDINNKLEKRAILGLIFLGLFILLEEIDYGMHWYDYLMGHPCFWTKIKLKTTKIRNIHNVSFFREIFRFFKGTLFCGVFCLFVFFYNNKQGVLIIPKKRIIFPIFFACFLPSMLHFFKIDGVSPEKYHSSQLISELHELLLYYTFFLYLYELKHTYRRHIFSSAKDFFKISLRQGNRGA